MKRHTARTLLAAGGLAVASSLLLTGCGQGFSGSGSDPSASAGDLTSSDKPLTIMIGSSGDAETKAVQDAVAAWSAKSGVSASVVAATDLAQQ
ncbi:hypothetical protein ACPWRM_24225, partial [Pandoraea pneumonica]